MILSSLISDRYVFNKNIGLKNMDVFDNYVREFGLMKTRFESHISLVPFVKKEYSYSCISSLNGIDITQLYKNINGVNRLNRIYNLYNGIINNQNSNDIYFISLGINKTDCFGYKDLVGITKKENMLCGSLQNNLISSNNNDYVHNFIKHTIGYNENIDYNDRSDLIKAITYKPSIEEISSKKFKVIKKKI